MPRPKHEHSLRNEHIGQAYMTMLDLYETSRAQGLSDAQISERLYVANPYRTEQAWLDRAWGIALREFCNDHQLPRYKTRRGPNIKP